MGSSRQVIRIDAEVNASLGNLNQVVTQLREGLSKGATQIDMSKGIGKSISGLIRTFQTEYDEFSRLTKNGVLNMDDSGPAIASAKKLLRVFDELQDVMSGIESKDANALKKLFPNGFDKNISNLGKELDKVGQKIKNLSTAKAQKLGLEVEVEKLQAELEQLKNKIGQPEQLEINVQQAEQRIERIDQWLAQLREKAQRGIEFKLKPEFEKKGYESLEIEDQIKAKRKEIQEAQEALRNTYGAGIGKNELGQFTYEGRTSREWDVDEAFGTKEERERAKSANKILSRIQGKEGQFTRDQEGISQKQQELQKLELQLISTKQQYEQLGQTINSLGNLGLEELANLGKDAGLSPEQIERITKALRERANAQEALNQAQQNQANLPENQQAAEQKSADIEARKKEILDLEKTIEGLKSKLDLSDLSKELGKLGINITPELLQTEEGAEQVRAALEKLDDEKFTSVKKALQDLGITSKNTQKSAEDAAKGVGKMDDERGAITRTAQDMENLKNRMLDFFSLTNTIQLFKRAVTQAFNTVKELDAVMTETAVVTDFSVGDMWDKLPQYSVEANKLGASISSLYQATTLYYQQGLETEAAMSVGIETMKMARIAGMEAAEATQAMTAALRGFNMEVNEINATRVNDVYSELAAITAADTEQIATAMTKTASIAASANMEFETTAALLAQIIETTQEAPETAGTAMKTIIARFTEVKSLFSEGQLTGKDEEGEAIDINKIDKALSSVGISLKDFLNGQKGIDDIFLELASKWDTLDLATQRYIATTAAGSRQQSRFIAMMSDYGRTMELVSAANNSAGASQRQFDKTQESLEAKLQKLKNAWDQFVMGIANSDLIKGGVETLTNILNIINTLIDKLSGGNGLIKGVLSLGAALGGLSIGDSALSGVLKFLSNNSIVGAFIPNLSNLDEFASGEKKGSLEIISKLFKKGKGLTESIYEWGLKKRSLRKIDKDLKNATNLYKATSGREKGEILANQIAPLIATKKKVRTDLSNSDIEKLKNKIPSGFLRSAGSAMGIAAAAIAASVLVAATVDYFTESDAEKKINLQKEVELSNESIKESQIKMTEIGSKKNSLRNLEKEFTNLTRGTTKWREQLVKTNEEVLRIAKEYPELQISRGDYGQLTIAEEEWNKIQKKQEEQLSSAQAAKAFAQGELAEMAFQEKIADASYDVIKIMEPITEQDAGNFYISGRKPTEEAGTQSYGAMSQADSKVAYNEFAEQLSDDQIIKYFTSFAEAGITALDKEGLDGTDRERIEEILKASGDWTGNEDNFSSIVDNLMALGGNFDILGDTATQTSLKMQAAAEAFYREVASGRSTKILSDEAASTLGLLMAGGAEKYDDLIEAEEERIKADSNTDADIATQYAAARGLYASGGKVYKDENMLESIDVNRDSMARYLAIQNIKASQAEEIEWAEEYLTTTDRRQAVEALMSKDGLGMSSSQWNKYTNFSNFSSGEAAKEFIADNFGLKFDLGRTGEEEVQYNKLLTGITNQFEQARKMREQSQIKLTKYFMKYNYESGSDFINADSYKGFIESILPAYEEKFGEGFNQMLLQAMQSVEVSEDEGLINEIFDKLLTVAPENFEAASKLITEIDWSNPIKASDQIQKAMNSSNNSTREFAEELNNLNSAFLSVGSQIQYFVNSTDFTEAREDIQKIVDKSGELTAMDVLDLAEDYEALGKILENNEVSASGLAKVLGELGEEGSLKMHQLTNTVLAAASGFDSLGSAIAVGLKAIDEFDPGINETDYVDFMDKAYKTLSENFEKGYYGNSQNFKYLDQIYGASWDLDANGKALTGNALIERMQNLVNLIGEDGAIFQTGWNNLFAGKDLYGNDIAYLDEQGKVQTGYNAARYDQVSSAEFIENLQEDLNIPKFLAEAMVGYFQNISPEFATKTSTENYWAAIEKAYTEAPKISGRYLDENGAWNPYDYSVIDQSEIEAIAKIWGKSLDEVSAYFEARGSVFTNFYDEDGLRKDTNEIIKELDRVYKEANELEEDSSLGFFTDPTLMGQTDTGEEVLDLNLVRQKLANYNLSEQDIDKIINQRIQDMLEEDANEEVQVIDTLSTGEQKTLTITPEITYDKAKNDAELKSQAEIAETVYSDAISEGVTAGIKAAFQDGGFDVDITADRKVLFNSIEEALEKDFKTDVLAKVSLSPSSAAVLKLLYPDKADEIDEILGLACGIKDSSSSFDALVSEEGPELIQRADGTAYLSGQNGPEITRIHRGDTVYTAEETRQIFRNRSGGVMPRFSDGVTPPMDHNSAREQIEENTTIDSKDTTVDSNNAVINFPKDNYTSSGLHTTYATESGKVVNLEEIWGSKKPGNPNPNLSSIKEEINEQKTSLDRLYNLVSQIEESVRQRERLERRYETLLEDSGSTVEQLIDISRQQLATLEEEKKLQEKALNGRQAEIDALVAQNKDKAQYVWVETNDSGDQVPRIDWDKINAIGNDDERKKVEEYIGKLEEKFDALAEIEKALWDIEDEVKEIESRGKDEYLEIEEIIRDAVEFHYQNQIDKLTEIDNSINETNSSMMQAIQDSLAQQRQERDNARTEEDLAEKERQLQYLKQDTSGANALEIMELEKELQEAQEDYTDTLIDQKLSAIQQQNDQASQERQMQIQILQNQLNYLISSGNIYDIVNDLRTNGIGVKGVITGSELDDYLQAYVGSLNLSQLGTTEWWADFNNKLKEASGYENLNKQLENLINEGILKVGVTITFTDGNGNTLTGVLQEYGSVKVGDIVYDDVYQQADGTTYATNETQGTRIEKEPEQEQQKPPEPEIPQWVKELEVSKGFGYENVAKKDYLPVMEALKFLGYGGNSFDPKAGVWDWDAKQALRDFQAANNLPVSGEMWTDTGFYAARPGQVENGIATRKALLNAVKKKLGLTQFKTGGVADFTGPAWLDGTKSRPEIILNQQDSRNFIQLKDILGSILKGNHYSSSSTENNGDTVYDIDINVEKLEREVDLDTISNYVERKITETARYRNNNAIKISR